LRQIKTFKVGTPHAMVLSFAAGVLVVRLFAINAYL